MTKIEQIVWLNKDLERMYKLSNKDVITMARLRHVPMIDRTYFWRKEDLVALEKFINYEAI